MTFVCIQWDLWLGIACMSLYQYIDTAPIPFYGWYWKIADSVFWRTSWFIMDASPSHILVIFYQKRCFLKNINLLFPQVQLGSLTLRESEEPSKVLKHVLESTIGATSILEEQITSLSSDNMRLASERATALKVSNISIEIQIWSEHWLVQVLVLLELLKPLTFLLLYRDHIF